MPRCWPNISKVVELCFCFLYQSSANLFSLLTRGLKLKFYSRRGFRQKVALYRYNEGSSVIGACFSRGFSDVRNYILEISQKVVAWTSRLLVSGFLIEA